MISNSTFNLLRCAIAMAYADGQLLDQEKEWLRKKFRSLPLTPTDQDLLELDLANGVDINDALPYVSDPRDRDLLLVFAENVFLVDGDFGANEQIWYERLVKLRNTPTSNLRSLLEMDPFPAVTIPLDDRGAMGMVDLSNQEIRGKLEKLVKAIFNQVISTEFKRRN